MKSTIYGQKMFVVDLILVSIWAYFYDIFVYMEAWFAILIRIAMCFEMRRHSPWTLVSATGFTLCYAFFGYVAQPFREMFRMGLNVLGQGQVFETINQTWITIFTTIGFCWLVVMPLTIGIFQRNIGQIAWKKKWIWIYLVPLTLICGIGMVEGDRDGFFLEGLFVALLPVIYWSIYDRKGRSLIQLILENNRIKWYLRYLLFFAIAAALGLRASSLCLSGLLLLPPIFYVLLVKSMRQGEVLTRCFVALSVSGLCYWFLIHEEWDTAVAPLIIALLLIIFAGVTMIVRSRKWSAAVILMLSVPTIVIPGILGLNPYVALDSDDTWRFSTSKMTYNGVYYFMKDGEIGLRDRYSVLLPAEYRAIEALDGRGRFVKVLTQSNNYGIYDLREREFVIFPAVYPEIDEFEPIDKTSFRLINTYGRPFATLYLPGSINDEEYISKPIVVPYFSEAEVPIEYFLREAQNVDLDIDDEYWHAMQKQNLHAYNLLVKMYCMGTEECSPLSDLNYAVAVKELITNDSRYKGNVDRALSEVEKVSETLTDNGSQQAINQWTDILRLIASMRVSNAYDSWLNNMPENDALMDEYIAWHNMMMAMASYQDYVYSFQSYLAIPEEKNQRIIRWLDYRREALAKEKDILSGRKSFSLLEGQEETLFVENDFDELFSNYHSFENPAYYNPMWNEIKWTFDKWREARMMVAEELTPEDSLSYTEFTREVTDNIFSFIKELDVPGMRPAL